MLDSFSQSPVLNRTGAAALLLCSAAHAWASGNDSPTQTVSPQRQHQVNTVLGLLKSDVSIVKVKPGAENSITADIAVNGKVSKLRMTLRSIRGSSYRLLAQVEGGGYVEVDPGPVQTYSGSLDEEPGSLAAGSLTDHGLYATVRIADQQQFWIEPVAPRMPDEDGDLYVAYRTEDVAECLGHCGEEGASGHIHRNPAAALPGHAPLFSPHTPVTGDVAGGINSVCTATLACDADHEYYVRYGSVSAVNNRIESVINAVNVEYASEVGITHELGTVIVRSTEPDPYSSTDANALLDQLVNHWRSSQTGVQRDAAQLFTGKSLAGSTIGLAYLGAICNHDYGYSLVESDSDPNFGCASDLSAHELGHNWNATHCTCVNPPYTMNPYNVCANHFHPTASVPQITSFRNSVNCIDCNPILEMKFSASGTIAGERFAKALAYMNDVTGDGQPDLIVGCPDNDEAGTNAGKVYVISGSDGSVLWSRKGVHAGDQFGYAVAASGSTVIVGAPYFDSGGKTNRGKVYIYNGATGAVIKTKTGPNANDRFGWSVAGGIDVNHDGQLDIMVGSPYDDTRATNAGAVYIYNGGSYSLLKKITGEKKNNCFGWSVAMIGMANSDAYGDFVVGAPFNNTAGTKAGKVYVYSGKTFTLLYAALLGAKAGDQFGRCVAAVGRVNGDNRADLAVGAPYYDNGASLNVGRVYVYSGPNGMLLFAKNGGAPDDQLGTSISTAGDVDGDGRGDVLVGAPRTDSPATNAGKVFVFSGMNGSVLAHFEGEAAGDYLGGAVAGWSASNFSRLAMGAAMNNGIAADTGRTYVYGPPSSSLHAPVSPQRTCAGDIANNDGIVNVDDVLALLHRWSLGCPAPCPPRCPQDINGDCRVDASDLMLILASWGFCP